MKTFIIAEAGANHDRKFDQAIELIDIAKSAGADACKFQTYSSETLYAKNTPNFANYSNINDLIKKIELPREWQRDLKQYCDEVGIEFMSTPFDERAVEELVDLGVKRLKIAGFESTDMRFVDMVASAKLPIIVSLGIGSDFSFIGRIMEIANKHGISDVTFLHCNNAYPTPPEDVNLTTIRNMAMSKTDYRVGFSDHTISPLTPALAVAAGAEVIEKHFTISRDLVGPDHHFALEYDQLKFMIDCIRYAELVHGNKLNEFTKSEEEFKTAMRSVVTLRDIKAGEILTRENITTKRPFLENSIPAIRYEYTLGKTANVDLSADSCVLTSEVE